MARELKATSIRLLPEEVDAVEKFRAGLEEREMMRVSTNAAVLRLVRIGLKETSRRAGK
jgi:hypothetical protein